jgi:transcriptional regulator with XRE-family HTH domain
MAQGRAGAATTQGEEIRMTLRQLRATHGLTQVAAAKLLRITALHLNDLETGRKAPGERVRALMARLYGVDLEAIREASNEARSTYHRSRA